VPYYVTSLDDLLTVAGTASFEGGQVSGIVPNLIANNAVSEALNMTISPTGNLSTRFGIETMSTNVSGSTAKVQGLFYFDTPTIEQLLVSSDGTLYKNTNATTFATTGGTHSNAGANVEFAQLNDLAYYVDGSSHLHYTDGTDAKRQGAKVLSVTVTTAGTGYAAAPTVTIGAPSLAGGVTATAIATVAGGAVTGITVTDGGSGYTSPPTVTISTGSGGDQATATANVHVPPQGLKLIKNFTNRLFAVGTGGERNTLYASDILDPAVWKATNSIVVGGDDGEDITAIQPYYGFQILVFKPTKIYLVECDPAATTAASWTVQVVTDRIGTVAGRSVSFVNKDVFFLAADGIRTLSRSVADDFTTVGLPVSEPVKDVIARINKNYYSTINATFHNNRYLLALPLDSATAPNNLLVYNALFNAFEGLHTIPATRMVETNFSSGFNVNGVKLAIGDNSGRVGHSFDYKDEEEDADSDYQDHGSDYTSRVVSKSYDFDDRLSLKYGSHYELEFFDSTSTADISMRRDTDTNDVTLGTGFDTSAGGSLTLPLTLPATLSAVTVKRRADSLRSYQKWRHMKLKVQAASKRLSLRSILLAANPDTIEVQKNIS
jgi:hypothetical protein